MKTDFSINVQVNIGVTPEVVQLVTYILQRTQRAAIAPAAGGQPAEVMNPVQGERGKAKQDAPTPDAGAVEDATGEPGEDASGETTGATQTAAEPKELTEQDIREAMHRARQRIEGEDYKNNTDSDGYKKYHKQLSATFKNMAVMLGSDKPSALPVDKREAFIKQCGELVLENGEITTALPF